MSIIKILIEFYPQTKWIDALNLSMLDEKYKLSHFPPCDFFFRKKSIEAKWQDEWSYRTEVHLYGLTLKAKQVFDLWYTA